MFLARCFQMSSLFWHIFQKERLLAVYVCFSFFCHLIGPCTSIQTSNLTHMDVNSLFYFPGSLKACSIKPFSVKSVLNLLQLDQLVCVCAGLIFRWLCMYQSDCRRVSRLMADMVDDPLLVDVIQRVCCDYISFIVVMLPSHRFGCVGRRWMEQSDCVSSGV